MKIWPFRRNPQNNEPANATASSRSQEVLVICHAGDHDGLVVMENLCAAMEFARMRYSVLDLARRSAWPPLAAYRSIVICTENIWELPSDKAAMLERFVFGGGGMLVAYRCWHEGLSSMFGMGEIERDPDMHSTRGFIFEAEITPGFDGLRIEDADWVVDHSRFDIASGALPAECALLATDLDGRPVAWRRGHGTGRVIYWNTGVLAARPMRGILLHHVLASMGTGVAATGGFALFQIDDFPPSLSSAELAPITREYPGLDRDGFLFGPWYDDIMALREKHRLKYSWYVVTNYHDVDNGPNAQRQSHNIASGKEVLQARFALARPLPEGDEYGFHGYNHDPLTAEGWPDQDMLEYKLRLARDLWIDCVAPTPPVSWVPANNWYGPDHARTLKNVFPEISVVCGLYSLGEFDLGEYRDFGPEPWEPRLTCIPRETYGYIAEPVVRLMMLSQLAAMGVWTHFIHADDVYDIPDPGGEIAYHRNAEMLQWKIANDAGEPGMLHQLDALISLMRAHYPWVEFVATSGAERRYRSHLDNAVEISLGAGRIEIDCGSEAHFYIRTEADASLRPLEGGKIVDIRPVDDGRLNVVHCGAGKSIFEVSARQTV
ncbi:MAG: DUF2194 domain-containing protein [Rhodobiaceae bacterium]|nr:DUF2194 domain-containing protein [Rhodobiaceae bacterium]MCC0056784.1 DUF2194 domain-containing protein [Rhodobiaceae bacterium]